MFTNKNKTIKFTLNIIAFNFSELNRVRRFLPRKITNQKLYKEKMLQKNKIYSGLNSNNEDTLEKPKDLQFYPKQHPKLIENQDTNIISYKPSIMNLTAYNKIPVEIKQFEEPEFESPLDSKGLDIGIIGPPNAGKSLLFNKLIGKNISAVSGKYNTTDDKIDGIYTDINERVQFRYYDTPGAIKVSPDFRSRRIITKAWGIIPECDKILFVVDSVKHLDSLTKAAIQRLLSHKYKPDLLRTINRIKSLKEENVTLEEVQRIQMENDKLNNENANYESKNISTILVMNKIDLVTNKRKLRNLQTEIEDIGSFDKVFHVSAETGFNIDKLKDYLISQSFRRPWKHHPEVNSVRSELILCEDTLKQIIYQRFYKEFPYNTLVKMQSFVPMNNGSIKINFQVEVKYDMNISMFIGKDARVIKDIREELNEQLTISLQKPVFANIFVVQRRKGLRLEVLNEMATS